MRYCSSGAFANREPRLLHAEQVDARCRIAVWNESNGRLCLEPPAPKAELP